VLSPVDLSVMIIYLAAVVGFGCWFVRKSSSTSEFMIASGSLPAWAVGLSIFGTYLSSNTFLGVPGKAYGSNWNAFVFSLSLPLAAWLATKFFVPFYRRTGEISAYQHLEKRFGTWARIYAVICYLLSQFARIGTILFGVSLALTALTGWEQQSIILTAGVLITLYTVLGGIEAVIWTDVVQSLVLIGGAFLMLGLLLFNLPEGPMQVFDIGSRENKFSLGSWNLDFTSSTFWVVLLFGLCINLSNFGIDQSFVQRYHTARSEREAAGSVWLGALLYLPISLLFFFIGTAAFAFYQTHPDELAAVRTDTARLQLLDENLSTDDAAVATRAAALTDAQLGDKVLPHFIVQGLPVGMTGLLVAAIFAAAMSSIDTSLNSSATILLSDIYKRFVNPAAGERESMVVLYAATTLMGVIGTVAAIAMIGVESVLEIWWMLSGVFATGMLGLFLLGLLSDRAGTLAAGAGIAVGLVSIGWMSWPKLRTQWLAPESLASEPLIPLNPLHENMTIVIGTMTILLTGMLAATLWRTSDFSSAVTETID